MRFVRYAVVFVAAFIAGMAGALPVHVTGLVVRMYVVWPLTLGTAAVLAAVAASWAANTASTEGSRSCSMSVLGVCGVAATAIPVFTPVLFVVPELETLFSEIVPIHGVFSAVCLISLTAKAAAWRMQGPGGRLGWDGAAMLILTACVLPSFLLENPATGAVLVSYEVVVWASLGVAVLGLLAIARCYSRGVSGRELARDAAITPALVAAILPVVSGTIRTSCSTLARCGA